MYDGVGKLRETRGLSDIVIPGRPVSFSALTPFILLGRMEQCRATQQCVTRVSRPVGKSYGKVSMQVRSAGARYHICQYRTARGRMLREEDIRPIIFFQSSLDPSSSR